MKRYAFGIDIGGTSVKLGLFGIDGVLQESWEIPTRTENSGENILPDIARSVKEKLAEKEIDLEYLMGIGVGVPGPVLKESTVNTCVNLGWGVTNVAKELQTLVGGNVPVKVGNDANVAALGEMWVGGGKGYKSIVMVTLGTGVGGGIILNGKILGGAHGAGGEIGHMHVMDGEKIPCNCGNYGCFEQYTSATGIVRKTREMLANETRPTVLVDTPALTAKDVFDAAKAGDAVANDVVEFFAEVLGKGLAVITATVDPEAIVIGGGVSRAGQIIIDRARKYYLDYAFHATRECVFKLASVGNDAGMYGAVKMVLD